MSAADNTSVTRVKNKSLRQAMAWLHTWGGLLPSWLLFVILFGGSIACFDKELEVWMRPSLHPVGETTLSLDQVSAWVQKQAPKPPHAIWMRPPDERQPYWYAGYEPQSELEPFVSFTLDPQTGDVLPKTLGGTFWFTLHYNLFGGMLGMYIVAIAGMFMLVALVSGIIIHRRIFKDFFTLRPDANGQRAWLDAHNLFGVVGLPFHLLIAYTGLAIFVTFYMPAGLKVGYKGDIEKMFSEVQGQFGRDELKRKSDHAASIDKLVLDAKRRWAASGEGGTETGWISVHHPGDKGAVVDIRRYDRSRVVDFQWIMSYDATTGAFLHEQKPYKPGYTAYAWLTNVHMAQFGGAIVRWLYLGLGLMGCAMVVGGLQVWLRKREAKGGWGIGFVRAMNGAVIGGLPIASLGLLYGNRLIPANVNLRDHWEAYAFVAVWVAVALWAVIRRNSGRVGRDLFAVGAVVAMGLPALDVLTGQPGALSAAIARGDWRVPGIDLAIFAAGLLCAKMAWWPRVAKEVPVQARSKRERRELVEESV
ncbi:putative iron-regulated membrane protein [Pseudomonas sp. TE3786]